MSLTTRAALYMAGIVAGSTLAILWLVSVTLHDRLTLASETRLAARLEIEARQIEERVLSFQRHARALLRGPILRDYLADPPGHRDRLEARFASLLVARPELFQARLIDAAGRERVRVDRRGDEVVAVPPAALQDKAARDYVRAVLTLAPGEAYAGPISLNREHGRISFLLEPALRVGVPVFLDGQRRGALVLNLRADAILPVPIQGTLQFRAVAFDGSYLLHPDPGRQFGTELGTGDGLAREFGLTPGLLAERTARGEMLRLSRVGHSPGQGEEPESVGGAIGSAQGGADLPLATRRDMAGEGPANEPRGTLSPQAASPGIGPDPVPGASSATDPAAAPDASHDTGTVEPLLSAAGWVRAGSEDGTRLLLIVAEPERLTRALTLGTIRWLVGVILCIVLGACLLAWLLSRTVTRRLEEVAQTARRIAAGDREAVAEIGGADELTDMARAFNAMTAQLNALIARDEETKGLLRLANREVRRSNADLASYARAAAHDLRTPIRALTALRAWLEEALPDPPEEARDHLAEMRRQIQRLDDLVKGLMNYLLVGEGKADLRRFDPELLLRKVIARLALPPGMRVETQVETGLVTAARQEVAILLEQLIGNAAHHHDRPEGVIHVRLAEQAGALILEVTDDGPGIPPAEHERVMQPLLTLRSRDAGAGSGMGLAMVDKIVRRWSGRVEIFSGPPARGTTFRVTLPQSVPPPPTPEEFAARLAAESADPLGAAVS